MQAYSVKWQNFKLTCLSVCALHILQLTSKKAMVIRGRYMQSLKLPVDAGTKSLEGLNSDYITSDSLTENQHSSSQHEYCHGRVNGQKDIL